MIINKRIAITVASIAISGAFGATALASQSHGQDGSRAGWGHGDKNHVHTGPSGQSVNVGHDKDDTRPGWGHGDKNHHHTGPSGQSVNIGHREDNDENEAKDDSDKSRTEAKVQNNTSQNVQTGDAIGANATSGNVSISNYFSTVVNFFAKLKV